MKFRPFGAACTAAFCLRVNLTHAVIAIATALIFAQPALALPIGDLDDLEYWGTGANRTALVIQWNDSKSPEALAWGYRWDTPGTSVGDMLLFLAANDPRLFARVDSVTGFGLALFGLGYQTGSSSFGVTGAQDPSGNPVSPVFTAGLDDLSTDAGTQRPFSSASTSPTNAADRYKEGWNDNGFWELFHSGTDNSALEASFLVPSSWTASFVGAGVELVNNGWAAFSISGPDFASNVPSTSITAAIPEPSTVGLLCLGLLGTMAIIRRRGNEKIS